MNNELHVLPNTMIMASVAKEKTDEVNKKLINDILNVVIYGINQSISSGEYYYDHNFIGVSDTQLERVKDALLNCGYNVYQKPGAYQKTFVQISWYNPTR